MPGPSRTPKLLAKATPEYVARALLPDEGGISSCRRNLESGSSSIGPWIEDNTGEVCVQTELATFALDRSRPAAPCA